MVARKLICALTLLTYSAVNGQRPDFTPNLVKIKGEFTGSYGFITAVDKNEKSTYFIRIRKDRRFDEQVSVFTTSNKSASSATLVQPILSTAGFNIAVYKLSQSTPAELKYFRSTPAKQSNYFMFSDQRRGTVNSFLPKLSHRALTVEPLANKNVMAQSIGFETDEPGDFGLAGTPVIDDGGVVTAVFAEDQVDKADQVEKTFIEALDMNLVQKLLEDMGRKSGSVCRYFTLIRQGSIHEENACQQEDRLKREEAKRIKDAEEQRVKELKQEEFKNIVDLYEKKGNREREVVKTYNKNRDRHFAMSIGGSGFISFMALRSYAKEQNAGNAGPSLGYSFGGNIYINPDKYPVRFVLKPRFSFIELGYSDKYTNDPNVDFKQSSIGYTAIELPLMMDLIYKRREYGDDFFSIGYGVAQHQSNEFTFTTNSIKTKEAVVGHRKISQHAIVELGRSTGRFRYSLFGKYQVTPYARSNYEIIIDGKSVFPFKDLSDHYWSLGLDIQFRLWNRWNNDYRTMQ